MSKSQGLRTKKKTLDKVIRKVKEQFAMLENYIAELLRANPASTIVLKIEENEIDRFQRIYICLDALTQGFVKVCRKLIRFDSCHLKSASGEQRLITVGIDANNGLYPVAWPLVETENKDSWS
ncbi:hypothetical protein ACH5RR_023795 [Cinchona calisaya]|uniref:Uncharacterized protein n=1 Tax=Cinchona calisaya TaxID=153742 RepID=A0ABD2ZCS3_9GENT